MGRTYGIILAGGSGSRMGRTEPKQFLPLGGMPVIAWSLRLFNSLNAIDAVIAVSADEHRDRLQDIANQFGINKIHAIVRGGSTRQESARNALDALTYDLDDILIFHDAARPFVTGRCVEACIDAARAHGAAAAYLPVRDTVAEITDGFVSAVPPRDRLYAAQTPQGFRYRIIRQAHDYALREGISATDDAGLAIAAGFIVKMVEGDDENIKITTERDYRAACAAVDIATRQGRNK